MRVEVTAEELIDCGAWDDFCEKHGINVWAVNEGLMDSDQTFMLDSSELYDYGMSHLINKDD